jgi:pimeloyl-ACP methyl ester carboxylesterase|tara:strand:- start:14646 stop:15482 length:837 start_codon:yes stop_codon:yes gene_type:complete
VEQINKQIETIKNFSEQKIILSKENTKISFRIWGQSGPILVLLHGGYGSWMHFLKNVEELSKNFQVIVPDMPGFGESEPLPKVPNLDEYAQTLVDALSSLTNGSNYNIIGFSFGSAIGSHMIKFAGDSVNRLTLVGYNRTGNMPFKRPKMLSWRAAKTEEELNTAQRHNLSVMMIHKQEKIDDMAINLQTLNTKGAKVRSLEIVASHDLPNRILNISQPIDIIWGEFDVTLINGIDDAQNRMKELIPDVKFHIIQNSGHWIQFEEYEKFNSTIEKIYL